jgi:hypothetical protein
MLPVSLRTGRPAARIALALAVVSALAGCARERPLPPAETFDWCGKAVSFPPPPEGWRREGTNDGGWKGVYFVLTGSVGERIGVADHRLIAERDRRGPLRKLLADLEPLDRRDAVRAISIARWRTDDPLSDLEAAIVRDGNVALDRAMTAVLQDDRRSARYELEDAIRHADRMELRLEDVIPRVKFRAEGHTVPGTWTVTAERDTFVAGVPALMVDYTWQSPERLYHGREFYFVSDHHVFMANFHGLEEHLGLFGRIVSAIALPDSAGTGVTGGQR